LEVCFGLGPFDRAGCLAALRQHRPQIEQMAREKYLNEPVSFERGVTLSRADLEAAASSA